MAKKPNPAPDLPNGIDIEVAETKDGLFVWRIVEMLAVSEHTCPTKKAAQAEAQAVFAGLSLALNLIHALERQQRAKLRRAAEVN
jgi:hypothetical protein